MTNDNSKKIDELVETQMRHRRPDDFDKKEQLMLRIRNVLNIVFMILAVVGAVVYLKVDLETGGWIIGTAVVIKTVEVALRLFKV